MQNMQNTKKNGLQAKQKPCAKRESNPHLNLGRVES
jgi:hypothetical protein